MYNKKYINLITYLGIFLLFFAQNVFAQVIGPNTIISTSTTYSNTDLDLTGGNFIVRNGATLTIENCNITGTIHGGNPNLISVELGRLELINNKVMVYAYGITQTPRTEASYYAIRMGRSSGKIAGNSFVVDQPFSVGLLTTSLILPVKNMEIVHNKVEKFHGVFYLLHSVNNIVDSNSLKLNSAGHIVVVGEKTKITNNDIYFPGANGMGNGIDIVGSNDVTISHNLIFTPTSVGIAIAFSRNLTLDENTVTGGITYAVNILSNDALKAHPVIDRIVSEMNKNKLKTFNTENINITNNYFGQNRYGITAVNVNDLTVDGNYFTQRFETAKERKFWTDNDVLFENVTGLVWQNNVYKEAFTQKNKGDNSMTHFVPFPASGGVVL